MKPKKQTVYLHTNWYYAYLVTNHSGDSIDYVEQKKGYFFTQEELNEYTQSVIKQALKTAAKKAECCEDAIVDMGHTIIEAYVEKKSITNTFEEIFKQFEV